MTSGRLPVGPHAHILCRATAAPGRTRCEQRHIPHMQRETRHMSPTVRVAGRTGRSAAAEDALGVLLLHLAHVRDRSASADALTAITMIAIRVPVFAVGVLIVGSGTLSLGRHRRAYHRSTWSATRTASRRRGTRCAPRFPEGRQPDRFAAAEGSPTSRVCPACHPPARWGAWHAAGHGACAALQRMLCAKSALR